MSSQAMPLKIILRTSSDLVAWDKQQKNSFLKFGKPGDAIRKRIKHVTTIPTLGDMVLDHLDQPTTSHKYPTSGTPAVLTAAAIADWNRDTRYAKETVEKLLTYHGEIISDCLEHVGQEIKESLEAEVSYENLISARDSFSFYDLIHAVINASGNAEIVVLRTQQYLNLKMEGNQHDIFINNIRQCEENFTRDMETLITPAMLRIGSPGLNSAGELKGFVKIQHLTAAIYIAGLTGDRFQKKRDEILSANPTVKIDTIWTEIHKVQQYALQMKHIQDREQGASTYISKSFPVKTTGEAPRLSTCRTCQTKFAPTLNYKGDPHQMCKNCYAKDKEKKKSSVHKNATPKSADTQLQQAKKQAAAAKALLSLQLTDDLGLGYVSENDDGSSAFFCAMLPTAEDHLLSSDDDSALEQESLPDLAAPDSDSDDGDSSGGPILPPIAAPDHFTATLPTGFPLLWPAPPSSLTLLHQQLHLINEERLAMARDRVTMLDNLAAIHHRLEQGYITTAHRLLEAERTLIAASPTTRRHLLETGNFPQLLVALDDLPAETNATDIIGFDWITGLPVRPCDLPLPSNLLRLGSVRPTPSTVS